MIGFCKRIIDRGKVDKGSAVKAIEAIFGADPDETVAILADIMDMVMTQSLSRSVFGKLRNVELGPSGCAEEKVQQDQHTACTRQ